MKNIVIGFFSVIIFITCILIIFSTNGRTARQQEVDNALNNAAEVAMKMVGESGKYAPQSNEELIADFIQAYATQINSSSDVELRVLAADYKKGLLSVEAVLKYRHLNGKEGSVSSVKHIVMETYLDELAKQTFKMTFKVNGLNYRVYTVAYGESCGIPPTPVAEEGKVFDAWKDEATGTIYTESEIDNIVPESDMEFIAIFT